jgi:hypothetical protein
MIWLKNCRAAPRTGRVPGEKESSMKMLVSVKREPPRWQAPIPNPGEV